MIYCVFVKVTHSKLRLSEVSYIRYLLTAEGLKPDQDKVTALSEMPVPTNVKSLQRF